MLEVTYVFPVHPAATVCDLHASFSTGSCMQGRVLAKQTARKTYETAVSEGHAACLLEKHGGDVMRLSLGCLSARAEVEVVLAMALEVSCEEDGTLRLAIPAVITPRYPLTEESTEEMRAVAEGAVGPSSAEFALDVDVAMPSDIIGIQSPSHTSHFVCSPMFHDATMAKAKLRMPAMPDREMVLNISLAQPFGTRCWLEPSPNGGAVMAVLHPDEALAKSLFPSDPQQAEAEEEAEVPKEFIFLLDRSGSMDGSRIRRAAEALQLFLRSLPQGCRFNIIGFGSRVDLLFECPVPYTAETLQRASGHAQTVRADLGGTELLRPLQLIFSQAVTPGFERRLVVLTDGAVCNTEQVLNLVELNAGTTDVYTIGVGAGVSHHLVKGLAEAGHGSSEFVAEGERLEPKVVRQLRRALRSSCSFQLVGVEWPGQKQKRDLAPKPCNGRRLVVCDLLSLDELGNEGAQEHLRLHFKSIKSGQTACMDVPVEKLQTGKHLQAAVGRILIRELEESCQDLNNVST